LSAVLGTGFVQHITDHKVAVARMVYAQPQAVIVGGSQAGLNIFQAVVPAVAAAVAQTGASGIADMGKVMSVLKTSLAGKADMGEVNKILKAVLSA